MINWKFVIAKTIMFSLLVLLSPLACFVLFCLGIPIALIFCVMILIYNYIDDGIFGMVLSFLVSLSLFIGWAAVLTYLFTGSI